MFYNSKTYGFVKEQMLQNIGLKITQIYKFPMAEKKNIFLNGLIDLAQ